MKLLNRINVMNENDNISNMISLIHMTKDTPALVKVLVWC